MYLLFGETNHFDRFYVVIWGEIIISIMILALFHLTVTDSDKKKKMEINTGQLTKG